jgi:membrane-bound serine protease (ClpP class)
MEFVSMLYGLLFNPNVAYVLLVLGLWALVAAVTTPGTGVPEVAAALCLTLAAVGLLQLPTNAVGVVLIMLSVGLFVVDLQVTNHGLFTLSGVVSLLLGSLFLFRSDTGELPGGGLSPWLVGGTIVASSSYFALALILAVRTRALPVRSGATVIVGARGMAKSAIPAGGTGTVQVASELWTALADEAVEPGTPVVVTALEGVRVHVARVAGPAQA